MKQNAISELALLNFGQVLKRRSQFRAFGFFAAKVILSMTVVKSTNEENPQALMRPLFQPSFQGCPGGRPVSV